MKVTLVHVNQYVLKTPKACEQITITNSYSLEMFDLHFLDQVNFERLTKMKSIVEEISKKYRRSGKYFDEYVEEGSL